MRGYEGTLRYTRNTADANRSGLGWDVRPFTGAVSLENMNLPSGDPNIRGQMKPFQSELYFGKPVGPSGNPHYNVLAPAFNYVASLEEVDSTYPISITRWAGFHVATPCEDGGAAGAVTNGYGIWVKNLQDSVSTLVEAGAAAIQLDGLNEYGRIRWGNEGGGDPSNYSSIYQVSESGQRRLELYSTGYVRTAAGVGFKVGGSGANAGCDAGSYSVAGTEIIDGSGNISTSGYGNFSGYVQAGSYLYVTSYANIVGGGLSVGSGASPAGGAFQVGSSYVGSPLIFMDTSTGNMSCDGLIFAAGVIQSATAFKGPSGVAGFSGGPAAYTHFTFSGGICTSAS